MDLNALQQKINNYITVVSSWVRNVSKLYFSGTPENVTVDMIDDNGNLTTTTLPNVAKFREQVWDDVGGAIGQFSRKIYINQETGSDNNSGNSNSPLFSLEKAFSLIPNGGHGSVYIIGNFILDRHAPLKNKSATVHYNKEFRIGWYESNGVCQCYRIPMSNSTIVMYIDTSSEQTESPILISEFESDKPTDSGYSCLFLADEFHGNVNITFFWRNRVQNAKLIEFKRGKLVSGTYGASDHTGHVNLGLSGYYYGDIVFHSGTTLADIDKCGTLGFRHKLNGISYKDENGNSLDIKNKITGVVRDSNGVPRNLLSNLVF